MKKYITTILLVITISGLIAGCGKNTDIGKDEAVRIALEDAGFIESDVTRLYVSKDHDDGGSYYEVQFTNDNKEYEYEILASDGNIISVESAQVKTDNTQTDSQTQAGQQSDNSQNSNEQSYNEGNVKITQEEAVKLALERVPGATQQDIRIELDYNDGYYKDEGDIIYEQKEYDFEIDAVTGEFLEWREERS